MTADEETRYVGLALTALGNHLAQAECFSKKDLSTWCPELASRLRGTILTMKNLRLLGFVVAAKRAPGRPFLAHGQTYYALTEDGIEAAQAAKAEAIRQTQATNTFAGRLWALVRMRQTITAADAAALLTDAGCDTEAARRRCSSLLLGWSATYPDALQSSVKRIAGQKRYVLLKDLGPNVPKLRLRAAPEGGKA